MKPNKQRGIVSWPLAVTLAVCMLGCARRRETEPPAVDLIHVVAQPADGTVWLSCSGYVKGDTPEGYKPVYGGVPIDSFAAEGAWVEPGDELFSLNKSSEQRRSNRRQNSIRLSEAQREAGRLKSATEIEDLEIRKASLEKQVEVLGARIAATLRQDQEELRVAQLEAEAAKEKVLAAQKNVERLRDLHATGIVSQRAWRDAQAALARAEQAARLPDVHLDVLQNSTLATTRHLLQLEQAMAAVELGDRVHGGGVFRDIQARWQQLDLEKQLENSSLRRWYGEEKRAAKIFSNNVVRATEAGVVRHQGFSQDALQGGHHFNNTSAMYVLQDDDMRFTIELPERWRDVQSLPADTQTAARPVQIDIPAIRVRDIPARIVATATLPLESRVPGLRHYACRVAPEVRMEGLKEGMQVVCRIPVVLPRGAVSVPVWVVDDDDSPRVTMADGNQRAVTGQRIGTAFVVFSGLAPGDRIRGDAVRDEEPGHRFKGYIRPTTVQDLSVPYDVEIAEMVAEGTAVRKGDVVARLAKAEEDDVVDPEAEILELRDAAQAQLAIDRVRAESKMVTGYVAWKKADLAVRKARLEYRVARYGQDEEERVSGDAALHRAKLDRDAAADTFNEKREQVPTGTVSDQQLRAAELGLALSEIRVRQADLTRVATQRRRDWMQVWDAEDATYQAEDAALAARSDYSIGREEQNLAIRRATEDYQGKLDDVRRRVQDLAELTVRAPFDGDVYYNRDGSRATLETGLALQTTVPFNMPVGPQREAVIELPAHLYGRFAEGDAVDLFIPAMGPTPLSSRVTHISRHFHESRQTLEDMLLGDTIGTAAVVFTITLEVPASPQSGAGLKPGMNAWIEVSS